MRLYQKIFFPKKIFSNSFLPHFFLFLHHPTTYNCYLFFLPFEFFVHYVFVFSQFSLPPKVEMVFFPANTLVWIGVLKVLFFSFSICLYVFPHF
jgi:hypothetical protein